MDNSKELFETTPSYIAGYVWLRCLACCAELALTERENPPLSCPTCGATAPPRGLVSGDSGIRDRLRAAVSRAMRRRS